MILVKVPTLECHIISIKTMTSEDLGLLSLVGNYLGRLAKECQFGGVSPLAIS